MKDYKLAKTFIINTLKALDQYQENLGKDEPSYSHTLFINACVGFLMVVNESIFDELPDCEINEQDWGISPNDIKVIKGGKSVCNVAKQMRHSIAHFNFEYEYSDTISLPIKHITLKNWKENLEVNELSFFAFKTFVLRVAEEALKIIDKETK
ncbi:MAG: hypothetical protein J6U49_06540 [Alistipes sp.]|nr:hypothetical protein [Alistipes sp.]